MNTTIQSMNRRGGYAMFAVLMVILSVSVLLAIVLSSSLQRTFMARKLADRTRANAIAETGICNAYGVLATNFSDRTNSAAFPSNTFAGGTYVLSVTAVSNNIALVRSRGAFQGTEIELRADLQYSSPQETFPGGFESDPFKRFIVSGGDMKWKTKAKGTNELAVVGGSIHGNKKITFEGENTTIEADVTASKKIEVKHDATIDGDMEAPEFKFKDNSTNVTGVVTVGPVPTMVIPKIDLTPYYNAALANGQVFNGNYTIPKGSPVNLAPPGGIMWINGKLTIDGTGAMVGCFIATKGIRIKGDVTQTKVADYPALVAKDGKIELEGAATYHGLIYAPKGDIKIKKHGSGTITGSIITGKKFKGEGPWSFMTGEDSTPGYPGGTRYVDADQAVGVAAWHR